MASVCASTVRQSKANAFLKTMGRAVRAVLFGGYKVYDGMVLPEFTPVEYPEDNISDPINFKKSTLEMEKLLLYLTYTLEKCKALSAENKILKKRIRTLLRKTGRLNIRVNVKWNSSVRKYQMSLSDDNSTKMTQANRHLPSEENHGGIPLETQDHQNNLQSRGSVSRINTPAERDDRNGSGRVSKDNGCSGVETPFSNGGYKTRKISAATSSKIPVPKFPTSPRSPAEKRCSQKTGPPLSQVTSLEKPDVKRRRTPACMMGSWERSAHREEENTTKNLLFFPSLMATIVSKTAERVKSNLDISWPSLYENCDVDQQFNDLFGEGKDIMPLVVWLSRIPRCSQRIFQRISRMVDSKGNSILHVVAQNDKYGMLPTILEHYPNSIDTRNSEGETALMLAATSGSAATVRSLLDAGAAPNAQDRTGRTALMRAVNGRHEQVVRLLLLCRGISIFIRDAEGLSAVDLAIRSDSVHIQCCFLMNSQMYT